MIDKEVSEFESQIRNDINFLLRDYPLKEISRQDFNKIVSLERARISCFSHRQLETIKGLYMYCHNERKKIRQDLIDFLNTHLNNVLKCRKIEIVRDSYNNIKKEANPNTKTKMKGGIKKQNGKKSIIKD